MSGFRFPSVVWEGIVVVVGGGSDGVRWSGADNSNW